MDRGGDLPCQANLGVLTKGRNAGPQITKLPCPQATGIRITLTLVTHMPIESKSQANARLGGWEAVSFSHRR
jgi:hypothetical protein